MLLLIEYLNAGEKWRPQEPERLHYNIVSHSYNSSNHLETSELAGKTINRCNFNGNRSSRSYLICIQDHTLGKNLVLPQNGWCNRCNGFVQHCLLRGRSMRWVVRSGFQRQGTKHSMVNPTCIGIGTSKYHPMSEKKKKTNTSTNVGEFPIGLGETVLLEGKTIISSKNMSNAGRKYRCVSSTICTPLEKIVFSRNLDHGNLLHSVQHFRKCGFLHGKAHPMVVSS